MPFAKSAFEIKVIKIEVKENCENKGKEIGLARHKICNLNPNVVNPNQR